MSWRVVFEDGGVPPEAGGAFELRTPGCGSIEGFVRQREVAAEGADVA